jgi:hypothetical protein
LAHRPVTAKGRKLQSSKLGFQSPSQCAATATATAAFATREVLRASGLKPQAARNAFLEVQRYEANAMAYALTPTPAAVRAAMVWREAIKVSSAICRVF